MGLPSSFASRDDVLVYANGASVLFLRRTYCSQNKRIKLYLFTVNKSVEWYSVTFINISPKLLYLGMLQVHQKI